MWWHNQNLQQGAGIYLFTYWLYERAYFNALKRARQIGLIKLASPRQGLATADNDRFLRYWYEVSMTAILTSTQDARGCLIPAKWFPYNKGGNFIKWYGNQEFVVNWQQDGRESTRSRDR